MIKVYNNLIKNAERKEDVSNNGAYLNFKVIE